VNVPLLVLAVLLGWTVLAFVVSPAIGARLAGRRMTHVERDAVAWGGLAVALALFLVAVLTIGAHQ
jgi:hypothetical protein